MKKNIIIAAMFVLAASVAWAAESSTKAGATPKSQEKPAAAPAELKAWAEEVSGSTSLGVVDGDAEKLNWEKLKKGHEFKPQELVRTGLGSHVLIKLNNGCYTEVKANTMIGISTLFKEQGTVHHNITLKYGSIKAKVEASKGENDFSVTTPRGTLSARGSKVGLAFAGDRGLGARGYSGTWHAVASHTGLRQNIQRGQSYNNTNALASALATQHRDVRLGDSSGGLSDAERQNLADNGGGRGVFNFDGGTNNGSTSFTDPAPASLPVYWTGSGTYYVIDQTNDISSIYGTGDWTRGSKSGSWEGSGTTTAGFYHNDGSWSGDIVNADGTYKTIDPSTTEITERGTWQGTANGSGTYVENTPTGGDTSRSGTWEGGGTFSGTSTPIIDGSKIDIGQNLTTGG